MLFCSVWAVVIIGSKRSCLTLFLPSVLPHILCPQHVSVSRVWLVVLRNQTALSLPGPLFCLFIHQLCLCLRMCGCVRLLGSLTFSSPHFSLPRPPTVCLSCSETRPLWPPAHGAPRSLALSVGSASVCVCQCS